MKNIQPTYTTFEQSKSIKEKEWQQRTKMVWLDSLGKQYLREVHLSLELNNAEYDAPEQWQIVEWLRVNHGIWIGITLYIIPYGTFYSANVQNNDNKHTSFSGHSNPQEAYSAAFDYILKKLI